MDNAEKTALLSIYKEGLEMEIKGHKFYAEACENATNEMAVRVFTQLKTDEIAHMKRIKEIYDALEGGEIGTVTFAEDQMDTADLKAVFIEMAHKYKDELKATDYEIKAIDIGIEFEGKAVDFYQRRLKSSTAEKEKKFCERLIEEERVHLYILTDMKEYYSDPAAWMLAHEHPHLD